MDAVDNIVVVGAGPKGVAIGAKRAALVAAGLPAPRLTLLDAAGVATHWRGNDGYTDGRRQLGTRPEKDLGFPYSCSWGEHTDEVNAKMAEVSWHAYLVATQQLGEWVDRGCPRPTHEGWAEYMTWAADVLKVPFRRGTLNRVDVAEGGWLLGVKDADGEQATMPASGLVFTGPGSAHRLPGQSPHPRVLDGRNVWQHLDGLKDLAISQVCVIGNGETAGAVTAALLDVLGARTEIELVSTEGVLFTRGESFTENHMYTEPSAWLRLPERQRRAFIRRTDRGVFSVNVQSVLDQADRVRAVLGRVRRLHPDDEAVEIEIEDGHETHCVRYDLVVVAVGFDALWWQHLLTDRAKAALAAALAPAAGAAGATGSTGAAGAAPAGNGSGRGLTPGRIDVRHIEQALGTDLAVEGLDPPLHLPLLAGLAQGPGFPNLSCLGLLSDRILGRYIPLSAPTDHGKMSEVIQ